jgi:hypothetical protein
MRYRLADVASTRPRTSESAAVELTEFSAFWIASLALLDERIARAAETVLQVEVLGLQLGGDGVRPIDGVVDGW